VLFHSAFDRRDCYPNLTSLLPCDEDETINSGVRRPGFMAWCTGLNVLDDSYCRQELSVCLVLLTARSCRVCWFLNTTPQ